MSNIAAQAPIRILVHGASGRMGSALLRLQRDCSDLSLAAAYARRASRDDAGIDILSTNALAAAPAFDVAIDFSLSNALEPILELCLARRAALVSGTTGLDATQRASLEAASREIPLLWSANFSIGVAVLAELVRRAAAALTDWDCDIVESHHVRKKDAPSGTALRLGDAAAASGAMPRYASLRAGDIIGEHLVQFTGIGERLELVHRATDRDVFARGALHAARWLTRRPAGLYRIEDMIGDAAR